MKYKIFRINNIHLIQEKFYQSLIIKRNYFDQNLIRKKCFNHTPDYKITNYVFKFHFFYIEINKIKLLHLK